MKTCFICISIGDTCPVCLDKIKADALFERIKAAGKKTKNTHPVAQNERRAGALHCLADCISKLERIIPASHKDEDEIKNTTDAIDWVIEEFDEFK